MLRFFAMTMFLTNPQMYYAMKLAAMRRHLMLPPGASPGHWEVYRWVYPW